MTEEQNTSAPQPEDPREEAPPPAPPEDGDDLEEDDDEGEGIDTRVLIVIGIIVVLIVIFFWRRSDQSEEEITPKQGQETAAGPEGAPAQQPQPARPGTREFFRDRLTETLQFMYRTDRGVMIVAQPPLPVRRTRQGQIIPPREGRCFYAFPVAKGVAPAEFARRSVGGRPMFANYPLTPLGLPKGTQPIFTQISKLNGDKSAPKPAAADDTRKIYGVVVKGAAKAYPVETFWIHDVINDTVGETPVVLVYSALAGAINAYERQADGKPLTFGCSGLQLRGANVVYDLGTWSLWSGLTGEAMTHRMLGKKLERIPVVTTTFGDWKKGLPQTDLMTAPKPPADLTFDFATGTRDYHSEPYLLYLPYNFRPKFQTPLKLPVVGVLTKTGSAAFDAAQIERTGKVTGKVGKTDVVVTWSAAKGFKATTADGKPLFCQKIYWFAWKSNYPKSEYTGPNKGKPIPPPKPPQTTKPEAPKTATKKGGPAAPPEKAPAPKLPAGSGSKTK